MENYVKIKTSLIKENEYSNNLYQVDENNEEFISSIQEKGILEPLVVRKISSDLYEVISGNRRLRAAKMLLLKEVPTIINTYEEDEVSEKLIVLHNQQRIKNLSEIINEIRIIRNKYGYKQGVRSDKDENAKKGKASKNNLVKQHNKGKIDKLTSIDKMLDKLSENDTHIRKKELKNLDRNGSISGTLKRLKRKLKDQENNSKVAKVYEIHRDDFNVYQKDSSDLSEIEDDSVQCIITSPPYLAIRDYKLGKGELGHEKSTNEFIDRLVSHFDESKRVLKPKGTLWVNLGDYVQGNGYTAVPEKFLLGMMNNGWMLHDKLIWIKNNPIFSTANRSVLANEYIYVFKKNAQVYYNTEWVVKYDKEGLISYGGKKLKSVFDFRGNIIKTNTVNNSDLRKECEKKGFNLTHNATFPISIPTIAILTSSPNQGDLILDVFHGTGTTGRSANLLKRRYIGYDLSQTFIKQSEIRLDMPVSYDIIKAA